MPEEKVIDIADGIGCDCPDHGDPDMAAPDYIDGVNASAVATVLAQTSASMAQGLAFVSEMSRHQFLRGVDQVGTREAQAMQEVRADRHAREILAQRAVREQPNVAAG